MVVSPRQRRCTRCIQFLAVLTWGSFYSIQTLRLANPPFREDDFLFLTPVLDIPSPDAPQPLLQPPDSFSACLLIMDENFRLYEWLSYHYHVLPLRYAVIAVDPRSALSPDSILDVFRRELNMKIVRWTDSDFVDWEQLPANASSYMLTNRHNKRQSRFLETCMEHLYQQNRTWTALWDVDEYIVFPGYGRKDKQNETIVSPPNLAEPGTVLKYLQETEIKACAPMSRVQVGTKEDTMLQQNSSLQLNPLRFNTLRYRYRNRNNFGEKGVGKNIGKVLLNVQRVDFPLTVHNPHRPAMTICPPAYGKIVRDGPFFLLHYVGSWAAYSFRKNDARKGWCSEN